MGEIDDIYRLKEAAATAFADTSVLFAYLYGSRVKGTAGPHSDYDMALFYQPEKEPPIADELTLAVIIEEKSGLRPIDLRCLNERPLSFQGKVVHEGEVVFSRDEDARIEFERKTLHLYLDFLPYLRLYDDKFNNRVAAKGIL